VTRVRKGGGNEQITIYFSQIRVYSLNDLMCNEYNDYSLVATTECFEVYILGQLNFVVWYSYHDVFSYFTKRRSKMAISIDFINISTKFLANQLITVIRVQWSGGSRKM